jgi:hypothetical protein
MRARFPSINQHTISQMTPAHVVRYAEWLAVLLLVVLWWWWW